MNSPSREAMWYYYHDGNQAGPLRRDQLLKVLREGEIPLDSLVWSKGRKNWQPAGAIPELASSVPPPLVKPDSTADRVRVDDKDSRGRPPEEPHQAAVRKPLSTGRGRPRKNAAVRQWIWTAVGICTGLLAVRGCKALVQSTPTYAGTQSSRYVGTVTNLTTSPIGMTGSIELNFHWDGEVLTGELAIGEPLGGSGSFTTGWRSDSLTLLSVSSSGDTIRWVATSNSGTLAGSYEVVGGLFNLQNGRWKANLASGRPVYEWRLIDEGLAGALAALLEDSLHSWPELAAKVNRLDSDVANDSGFVWAARGVQLLPGSLLALRANLLEKMLRLSDEPVCAAIARGTQTEGQMAAALSTLDSDEDFAWARVTLHAMAAEVRGDSPQPVPTDDDVADALEIWLQGHSPTDADNLVNAIANPENTHDRKVCWATRLLYSELPSLPEPHRSVILRILVSS